MRTNTIDRPRMTEARINKYFELAKQACKFSDMKKAHLGSVLIYKNKVISVGWNVGTKTSPIQKEYNKYRDFDPDDSGTINSLHAEMLCLHRARNIDIDWSKASLFTYREKKNGDRGLARSCPACYNYAKLLGLGNLYYTTEMDKGWDYERIEY